MKRRQTKHGLTLIGDGGTWRTEDGKYNIARVRALSFCDNPHPMRVGRFGSERWQCPGDQEHDVQIGWDTRDVNGHSVRFDDVFPTLNEAWRALAQHIGGQDGSDS